jgi:hypothetical protein
MDNLNEKDSNEEQNLPSLLGAVSHSGLTEIEFIDRERLLELQKSTRRWFSQQEFDRLKKLSTKMFKNAGPPLWLTNRYKNSTNK